MKKWLPFSFVPEMLSHKMALAAFPPKYKTMMDSENQSEKEREENVYAGLTCRHII